MPHELDGLYRDGETRGVEHVHAAPCGCLTVVGNPAYVRSEAAFEAAFDRLMRALYPGGVFDGEGEA